MIEYTVRVYGDGDRTEWYLNDKRHRVDGPAVEWADGSKEWYLNDKRHRVDGPAVEWTSGSKYWYLDGKLHRVDGPAIEWTSGSKYWYLDGIEYSKEDYDRELGKRNNSCDNKVVEIDGKKYKLTAI